MQNFFKQGRMISSSKTSYMATHPDDLVVFNANIISDKTMQKIWHGDLNVTEDTEALMALADELQTTLYVLREMDARFENEEHPLIENAVAIVDAGEIKFPKKR